MVFDHFRVARITTCIPLQSTFGKRGLRARARRVSDRGAPRHWTAGVMSQFSLPARRGRKASFSPFDRGSEKVRGATPKRNNRIEPNNVLNLCCEYGSSLESMLRRRPTNPFLDSIDPNRTRAFARICTPGRSHPIEICYFVVNAPQRRANTPANCETSRPVSGLHLFSKELTLSGGWNALCSVCGGLRRCNGCGAFRCRRC